MKRVLRPFCALLAGSIGFTYRACGPELQEKFFALGQICESVAFGLRQIQIRVLFS